MAECQRRLPHSQGHIAVQEYLEACNEWTPLMLAAADRLSDVAEELLRNGADPTVELVYQGITLTALLVAQIYRKPSAGA